LCSISPRGTETTVIKIEELRELRESNFKFGG
jgi:hypothetical protein